MDPTQVNLKPDDMLLTDQVAVVTGGGGGIGQGIAVGMAQMGADVVVLDIEPLRCDETQRRVEEAGRRCLAVPTDCMDTDAIRAAVAQGAERFGRLDILVNNAGGSTARPFLEQSERSWRRHIDLNLVSMLAATQATARVMVEGGRGGSIVNVPSIEGLRAAPGFAVYAACKAGMISFTRTMALELSEHGIRVNGIAPDMTTTPGMRGNRQGAVDPSTWTEQPPEHLAATARYIPLGRWGLVEECASAAVFLSSRLGAYVSGVTINVDGGTWASSGWTRGGAGTGWTLTPGLDG